MRLARWLPPWLPPEKNRALLEALEAALPWDAPEAPWEVLDLYRVRGEWLDLWGALFGIPRTNESDDAYRQLIIATLTMPKNTLSAIRSALTRAYGPDVEVRDGSLSHNLLTFPLADGSTKADHRFWPDEGRRRAMIHVRIGERYVTPGGRIPALEIVRPAGVIPVVDYRAVPKSLAVLLGYNPLNLRTPLADNSHLANGSENPPVAYPLLQATRGAAASFAPHSVSAFTADGLLWADGMTTGQPVAYPMAGFTYGAGFGADVYPISSITADGSRVADGVG